ncbi:hypothetical protein K491DRAFT_33272 [Lophiostoma macrostomum CBS 122681]|uniref:Zn(2)-C6 fungal-type domain-containing protein n=1 Tax=Lophiostoma macrostomum CBS 122681 TaxID=1314788 RepID=A0A6A6SYS3_9PLEO|nr:hypothetical protein K491DRAFT_33272 [Lophiostoma macrostomum CBS 122681]
MPKRSAGCFECRKRKVRCDETKPECNTCVRRGTKCPGYRPTQSFILHTFDGQERVATIREDENRYKFANHKQGKFSKDEQAVVQLNSSETRPVDAPVPRQVSPAAIDRCQFLSHFLELYLPKWKGEILTPPSAMMLDLPDLPASKDVFLAALDALSLAQLAVQNKNYPLINRTRSLYGTALTQLMRAIARADRSREDETLLATYLLGLYEVFVGVTGGHGFFYHVQGCLHLLKTRGPASLTSKLAIDIFHGVRYNSIAIGYRIRRASILDSPEWLEVTRSAATTDPYVSLIDICIHVPRILERIDNLTNTRAPTEEFEKLIVDCELLAERAFHWHTEFFSDRPRYREVSPTFIEGCPAPIISDMYDPVFMFNTFADFTTLINYWMAMLVLRTNTFRLVRKFRKVEPKDLFLWDREMSDYADKICRSVPYGSRPAAGYSGRFGTLSPLVSAKLYFEAKNATKEAAWCEEVYYGTKVPGLYSPPVTMESDKALVNLLSRSSRYIL